MHVITLRAVDLAGAAGDDSITVSVGVLDGDPIASISGRENFDHYFLGQTINLLGVANDPQQGSDTLGRVVR